MFFTVLTSSSVWNRFIVLIAWLVRLVHFFCSLKTIRKGHLTPDDYDTTTGIVRVVQHSAYSKEIKDLKSKGSVKPSSKICEFESCT